MNQINQAYGLLLRTIAGLRDWRLALACFWPVLVAEFLVAGLMNAGQDLTVMALQPAIYLLAVPSATAWHRSQIRAAPPRLRWGQAEWTYAAGLLIISLIGLILYALTVGVVGFSAVVMTGNAGMDDAASSEWFAQAVLALSLPPMMWVLAPHLLRLPAIALGVTLDGRELSARLAPYRPAVTLALVVGTLATAIPAMLVSEASLLAATLVGIIGWPLTVGLLSHAFLGLYPDYGRGMEDAGS